MSMLKIESNHIGDVSMVSMSDTLESPMLPACCMRKNPTPQEVVYDGMQINLALVAVYFVTYALDYKVLCLSSFISFMLITLHMYSVVSNNNRVKVHDDFLEKSEELSQKQIEQGATYSRGMTEEQEDILYDQLHQVVEETRKRNQARRAMIRTPTGTSLATHEEEDEEDYSDMPPLVAVEDLKYKTVSYNAPMTMELKYPTFDIYKDVSMLTPVTNDMYAEFPSIDPYIPVVRDILGRATMDDVD